MAQVPQVPDSDDDELGVPTGAAGSQQVPPNPFSPTGSAAGSPMSQDMLVLMMNRMSEMVAASTQAATAAALAAQSVHQSVQSPASSPERGQSSTSGFADANKILTRPTSFGSASHEHDLTAWVDWSHAFKCWLVFAEAAFEAELQALESNLNIPVKIESLPEPTAERSRRLYAILSSLLQHKPKALLRQVPNRCGFEVWRQMVNIYAPKSKMRSMALLNAIMSYPAFEKSKTLREQLDGMERVAAEYERVSGRAIDPHVMLGTLLRCLPQAIKQHVQLSMDESSTYESVRQYVL